MITGFFDLETPKDLLKKLRHDLIQMELHPFDIYLAYNFFVTAEAMLDWIYPGNQNRKVRTKIRNSEVILQITSDLATGAKHFSGLSDIHKSVVKTDISAGYIPRGYFPKGAFPVGFFGDGMLRVHLDKETTAEDRTTFSAFELASRVLTYWEEALTSPTDD
jgi:hypothetical protein